MIDATEKPRGQVHLTTEENNDFRTDFTIDRAEARRFLAALDPNADKFTWQTFDDDKKRKAGKLAGKLAGWLHGSLGEHWNTLVERNRRGAGIFVMVQAGDGSGRNNDAVRTVRAVLQDDDDGWKGAFPLPPHIEVESSPGKFQRYWLVEGLTKEGFKGVMNRMIADYGSDPNAKDLARVLRLPGFWHLKDPAQPFQVRIVMLREDCRPYPADELLKAFPPLENVRRGASAGNKARKTGQEVSSTPGDFGEVPDHIRRRMAEVVGQILNTALGAPPEIKETPENIEAVQALLAAIPAKLDRGEWRDVIWGVLALEWDCSEELAQEWSESAAGDYPDCQEATERVIIDFNPDGGIKFGTVVEIARRHGWAGTLPWWSSAEREEAPAALIPASQNPELEEEIARLAALTSLDYERERNDAAKALNVRVSVLDEVVRVRRQSGVLVDGEVEDDGRRAATLNNVIEALRNPRVSGIELAFDNFESVEVWRPAGDEVWRPWSDEHNVEMRVRLAQAGIKEINRETFRDARLATSKRRIIDLAHIWAESLPEWDGVPRCEAFFSRYFGMEDNEYTRAVGRYTWSALAGRLRVPGIKADAVPVLIGRQGCGKSRAIEAMAPTRGTFESISFTDNEDDLKRKIEGKLVVELGELAGVQKREVEWLKGFISATHDARRPTYQEFIKQYPRRCLFIGSTNRMEFINDPTGGRRWLPLEVGVIDVDGVTKARDQLWAEALWFYAQNGICFAEAEHYAAERCEKHREANVFTDLLRDWLAKPTETPARGATAEVWGGRPFLKSTDLCKALSIDIKDYDRLKGKIGDAMRELGYQSEKRRYLRGQGPFRAWVKQTDQ